MNEEDKGWLRVGNRKAYRQIHEWGYAVEQWVLGLGFNEMAPLWNSRSAAGRKEEGAEDLYRSAWKDVADVLLRFGFGEDSEAGFGERLGQLQGAVEVEDAGAAGVKEVFSEVGVAVLAEGGISDDLWKKTVAWAERKLDGEQEEDFIGLLKGLANNVTEEAKRDASVYMGMSQNWNA